jgi:hypothetical protein
MDNPDEIPAWLEQSLPYIEWLIQRYEMLSQEHQIWFWIVGILPLISVVVATGYMIYRVIRCLNALLQTPEGWCPVQFKCWMWVGSGIWLLFLSHSMRMDEIPAWSVVLFCGILTILLFVWYMYRRLKFLRGTAATVLNSGLGLVVAPVVIQSVLLLVTLLLACVIMWIHAVSNTSRVVYVNYR